MKRRKRIMVWLFSLVIGFSMLVPNDVFAITNEDNHVETVQTNLANDQLAKQNESGIHDIFYPKDNSKLELFKARIFNRLLYKDEEIDVSDIDISPNEIQYISSAGIKTYGEYAARSIVVNNAFHSTLSTIGFPTFTYKENDNVATVKYTYHPVWTEDFIKRAIAGYDEVMSLINPNDTDFAKALKFHDWIVKNVAYLMNNSKENYGVGALADKKAICAGYAQCYQFLLSQVGIESIYIAAKTTKEPHAWNLVKIDGHYFHVDCTWDRGLGVNPNVNHTYFMLNDEEFNANGYHTDDWKDPSKGYPTNNQCNIENKFYKDYKVMATDEQIAANPIKIKHVYDDSTTYNTSSSEHWRTCVAGVEVHEKHDGDPCSVCHYENVKVCDHSWINNHDDSYHWEECNKCKEIRNKEKHTPKGTWEKDDNSHWVTCTKCSNVKLNKINHIWCQEYDATYHWKQCSICGYETTKAKHSGNPCTECNYESSHVWKENHNDTKHWQECSICHTKQNEEGHTAKAGWLNDSNNHWQVCSKCSDVKMNNASHTWVHKHDEKSHWNECNVCGYIANKEDHVADNTYEKDANNHWNVCTKCSDIKMNIKTHTFVQRNDETYHWKQCSTCGYETSKAKHNGNPCKDCKYESNHIWVDKHDSSKHWQECSICHTNQNEENHTAKTGWLKDSTNHWQVCTKCSDIKMNIKAHTFVQKYDGTYHWKQCSICGYETAKTKHSGNPCSECNYESNHIWVDKHDSSKHWQECSICHKKQNEENHTAKSGWLKDSTNHWQICSKCSDVKMNVKVHTFVQKNDRTYHWKQCSTCGYETTKEKHSGNPCKDCNYKVTTNNEVKDNASVRYQTHVQTYGWQNNVFNGQTSGTTGKSKRLEAIRLSIQNTQYKGSILYRTHIQTFGWENNWKADGEMSGTSGKAKRLEAIQIKLTGELAEHYDIYYRVHAQHFGWLDWAKNGQSAGTATYSYRLEAIEVRIVEKGKSAPGSTARPFHQRYVFYQTHVQTYGWQGGKYDGEISGTTGQAKRLEGIRISLPSQLYSGTIQYRTHVQTYGWESNWKSNGEMSGTSGKAKRLEAIQIQLTGEMAKYYDVYYRVHAQRFGWLDWAKNGQSAGTAGYAYRLEGIQIVLVSKGGKAPGNTSFPFHSR